MSDCPICGRRAQPLFTLRNAPRLQNVLFDSESDAKSVARGDYGFEFCPRCIHGFNPRFQADEIEYDTSYDNDQSASKKYRSHVEWVVRHLATHCGLGSGSKVLEIGCGNGFLLSRLHRRTRAQIAGYDPAYNGKYGDPSFFKREYFRPKKGKTWDLVILRHCLDSFTDPEPILRAVRAAVGTSGRLYVESADLDYILDAGDFSLFYHECARYFSKNSLAAYLGAAGFVLESVVPSFGGQYFSAVFRAVPDPKSVMRIPRRLKEGLKGAKRALIWGVSGRAVTILSHLSLGPDVVAFGVDIAKAKQGRHIPVTGQRILSPEEAVAFDPDLVVVCNALYADEIRQKFPISRTRRFLTLTDADA